MHFDIIFFISTTIETTTTIEIHVVTSVFYKTAFKNEMHSLKIKIFVKKKKKR